MVPAAALELPVDVVFPVIYRASLRARKLFSMPFIWKMPNEVLDDHAAMWFLHRTFVFPKVSDVLPSDFHYIRFQLNFNLHLEIFPFEMPQGPFREGKVVQKCSQHFRVGSCPLWTRRTGEYITAGGSVNKVVKMENLDSVPYEKFNFDTAPPGHEEAMSK